MVYGGDRFPSASNVVYGGERFPRADIDVNGTYTDIIRTYSEIAKVYGRARLSRAVCHMKGRRHGCSISCKRPFGGL